MSRFTTQSLPVVSPAGLGELTADPASRQIFAASVGMDQTAGQLLQVLESAGQAVSTYARFEEQKQQQEIEAVYESASSEILDLSTRLNTLDPTADDYEPKASALRSQIVGLYSGYKDKFEGTRRGADWTNLGGRLSVDAAKDLQQYRKDQQNRSNRLMVTRTANDLSRTVLETSATKEVMDQFIREFEESEKDPKALLNTLNEYILDTLTDEQMRAYQEGDEEVRNALQSQISTGVSRLFSEVQSQQALKQAEADRQIEEADREAAVEYIRNNPSAQADVVLEKFSTLSRKDLIGIQSQVLSDIQAELYNPQISMSHERMVDAANTLMLRRDSMDSRLVPQIDQTLNTISQRFVQDALNSWTNIARGSDPVSRQEMVISQNRANLSNTLVQILPERDRLAYERAVEQGTGWEYLLKYEGLAGNVAREFDRSSAMQTAKARTNTGGVDSDKVARIQNQFGVASGKTFKESDSLTYAALEDPETALAVVQQMGLTQQAMGDNLTDWMAPVGATLDIIAVDNPVLNGVQLNRELGSAAFALEQALMGFGDLDVAKDRFVDATMRWEQTKQLAHETAKVDLPWIQSLTEDEYRPDHFKRAAVRLQSMGVGKRDRYLSSLLNRLQGDRATRYATVNALSDMSLDPRLENATLEELDTAFKQYKAQHLEFQRSLDDDRAMRKWDNVLSQTTFRPPGSREKLPMAESLISLLKVRGAIEGLTDAKSVEARIKQMEDNGYKFYPENGKVFFTIDRLNGTPASAGVPIEEVQQDLFPDLAPLQSSAVGDIMRLGIAVQQPVIGTDIAMQDEMKRKFYRPPVTPLHTAVAKLISNGKSENLYDLAAEWIKSNPDYNRFIKDSDNLYDQFRDGTFVFQTTVTKGTTDPQTVISVLYRDPGKEKLGQTIGVPIKSWVFNWGDLELTEPILPVTSTDTGFDDFQRRVLPLE